MFFFNDTATTEIYTLSLHDALPISTVKRAVRGRTALPGLRAGARRGLRVEGLHEEGRDPQEAPPLRLCHSTPEREGSLLLRDRKSTRLNSSHANISYAVFCLKKKIQ